MSDPNPNITPAPGNPPPAAGVTPTPPAAAPKFAAAPRPAAKVAKPSRRFFLLEWINLGWVALTASLLGMTLGTVRFLFPNVLSEPPSKIKVGFPDNYEEGKVVERYKDQNTWVVRYNGIIYALSTTCTHLGCTPNWLERENKFKCPCHGSGFYITGINFEGPAPRPLERWGISIGDDGQIVVDKAKKFQQERGEWNNPESYIKV
ncbi:MAG TPA: ubiquinol-cytochrome c reductase iron-sulfur subunit [Gemmataceae bacterium]|nr:ubiquinol-cytochrome c reductase iron-sulfur subunit [Gemmataceae bacterium]